MGSPKKTADRLQCKQCGYKIYYRPKLYRKIQLKHSYRVLCEFKKVTNNIFNEKHIKPSIRNIKKNMGAHGKVVHITTIARWLNRFYPNREMSHYKKMEVQNNVRL